ncbi:MAG: AmmeMemoRadiSam system radical SAM enzyme [Coriobacteriales bacterium]|jgi:pyruvate formate lyase activating enzyme|nr:AmmeMemoRadiSam system radical SAM enzyme [Coriobacteriales bacterium]
MNTQTHPLDTIRCSICPHSCRLRAGKVGICGAREAQGDKIVPLNYGRSTALALDPIEKKPLACYLPGSKILSYGSYGCNLGCSFCQNWKIAQILPTAAPRSEYISPEVLVRQAQALRPQGNIGIAFTYNEPLICPEYLLDVAELAHAQDLKIVLVTNGYVMGEVAEQVFAVTDAANIDLKAFHQDFYTEVGAPAGLATVKRTIQTALSAGCHVEVTTLIVPGLNDSPEEMAEEAAWLASLNRDIPLHINRFSPAYQMMDSTPTPRGTLDSLALVAREHLSRVFIGNV